MKTHDLRPTSTRTVPKAHAGSNKILGHSRGYELRQKLIFEGMAVNSTKVIKVIPEIFLSYIMIKAREA